MSESRNPSLLMQRAAMYSGTSDVGGSGRGSTVSDVCLAMTPPLLPIDNAARKAIPVCRGMLDYFPAAIAEVSRVSQAGNDQHNPGEDIHWARGKSMDHADCIVRHLMERGTMDEDGMRHSAKLAWRALALLQQELEDAGFPISRGSR